LQSPRGAALGALLRWQLGFEPNNLLASIPPGTLTAKLVGGHIIGLAVACLAQAPEIAPEWRLFIITGLCGGLTTFSTLSAEVVTLLPAGRVSRAIGDIVAHVTGSLAATLAGRATWHLA